MEAAAFSVHEEVAWAPRRPSRAAFDIGLRPIDRVRLHLANSREETLQRFAGRLLNTVLRKRFGAHDPSQAHRRGPASAQR